jgi:hypothetical protein
MTKALTASRADELFMNSPLQETPGAETKNNSPNTLSQTAIRRQSISRGHFCPGCWRIQPDTGDAG